MVAIKYSLVQKRTRADSTFSIAISIGIFSYMLKYSNLFVNKLRRHLSNERFLFDIIALTFVCYNLLEFTRAMCGVSA